MLATVSDAVPLSTAALVLCVLACLRGSGGGRGSRLFGMVGVGFCFHYDLVVLPFFLCYCWVGDFDQIAAFDFNILFTRQQVGKGSRIILDILKTLIYCVD